MKRIFFILLLSAVSLDLSAGHFGGMTMTSECLNPCTTRIHLKTYRICTTPVVFSTQITWSAVNNCTLPNLIGSVSPPTITDVTPVCPGIPLGCTNRGFGGAEEVHTYQDYEVCSSFGCVWTYTWSTCCRSGTVTSATSQAGVTLDNTIDFSQGCNTPPVFPRVDVIYTLRGEDVEYFVGGIDPDGDSLTYDFQACQGISIAPFVYQTGHSPTAPLGPAWDVSLGHHSGALRLRSLIPNQYTIAPICILVTEYRNGNVIATTWRDLYIITLQTPPTSSSPQFGQPINLSPGSFAVGSDSILACPGQPLCFDIPIMDSDSSQVPYAYWHASMPGVSFTDAVNPSITDTVYGNPGLGRFCWNNPTPGTHYFILQGKDGECPFENTADKVFTLVIGSGNVNSLISGFDSISICDPAPVTLTAAPGFLSYYWSNADTSASTSVTSPGTYSVTVTNGNGCAWQDSFVVVPDSAPQITGTILNHLSIPLENEKVVVYILDWSDSTLNAVDSTFTDPLGYYEFCGLAADSVYIHAQPGRASAPNTMLTYADTAYFWNTARAIPKTAFPLLLDFTCREFNQPTGTCRIGGTIRHHASQAPVPGLLVQLHTPGANEAINYDTTDANGYFLFTDLASGTYATIVDKPFVDHSSNIPLIYPQIDACQRDSLSFTLHPTWLELDTIIVSNDPGLEWQFALSPNPADQIVKMELTMDHTAEAQIRLIDIHGRTLENLLPPTLVSNQLDLNVNTSGLASGLYFVEVVSEGRRMVEKLMIRR